MVVQMTISDLENMMTQVIRRTVVEILNQNDERKTNKEDNENKLLTRNEAAKFLNVEKETLWHWDKKGELKALKIGRRVYYKQEDIMAKLRSN